MKRGIATITVYVNGETDKEWLNSANEFCEVLNDKFDCRADVEKLHDAPFGSIGSEIKEIDITKIHL